MQAVFTGNYQEVESEVIVRRRDNFFKNNINPEFEISAIKPFTIWSQNNLRIDYVNDELVYYMNDKQQLFISF